jgi:hypothetical protein
MISGREALGSIDQTLNQALQQIAAAESEIAAATERLVKQQKAQADGYRELARVRLDRLSDPELVEYLDHSDRQAVALLEARRDAIASLQQQLNDADRIRAQHEAERQHQSVQLDGAVAVVDQAEARTQARLADDPQYVAQRDHAEQAERKALHAAEKAGRSEEEREQKGAAYRQDALFQYLWKRRFGLPEYRAGGLVRWLDGKVARLIGFADARANFSRLNEIPLRLREHADHLRAEADREYAKLKELDEVARAADGIPALEAHVAKEQAVLDQIDERIQQGEQDNQALLREQASFATGDDEFTRRAIEFLSNEFRRDDLMELRRDAVNTPYPEDDVIVSRMLQGEQEHVQLEATIGDLKGLLEQHQQRLQELESLRRDFKRKRFDRVGSEFDKDSIIPLLLGQFLAGMLDRGMLWKVLQEHQRYRPRRSDPGFGSGGFGRGTVWKGGMGDLGDIIGSLGRGGFGGRGGGHGGGGGFRTGGGF